MCRGFMYLVVVVDWFSLYIIARQRSNTLDGPFCLATLNQALELAKPETFYTDQSARLTAHAFTDCLVGSRYPY